ncbi:Glycoside hydrolase family 5 protein [Mycena indigotica]|uniref:cellulase n=1 Tax=Mycena indigotica TaxID=2126181 RepID=A0A8H6STD0_9AGAR|nr:Glycoside hydrolase family 5 protein [Mycena indigotica]KAF7303595.1 Glycoside hydrolase family 5 protein [Mycena indigotica]
MARSSVFALATLAILLSSAQAQSNTWEQCGGQGWTGPTTCVSGAVCTALNSYYSQCVPGTATTTLASSTVATTTTASAPGSSSTAPAGSGKLRFVGVNISGFDFGCNTDGSCTASAAWPPLTQFYGAFSLFVHPTASNLVPGHDGQGQMNHFVKDGGFNVFRLPVGWQFLTNDVIGPVSQDNLTKYDALVQACLNTASTTYCIIDIHNYARWNGKIIGQGGPTNAQFADTWSTIATKYKSNPRIMFGVMNEPHDVPDIVAWAASVQAAVTAIRNAGATTQLILLPGNNWTSAETFVSNGSAAALAKVVNPDGTTSNLIFDVHKYLDSDNSGTHPECVMNNIDNAWSPLATWLRQNKRQAFNTETGGGNTASCAQFLCQQIAYQAQNSDVFLGYVGWAAGNFDPSYVLSEVPTNNGGTWTDTSLVAQCIAPKAGAQKRSIASFEQA